MTTLDDLRRGLELYRVAETFGTLRLVRDRGDLCLADDMGLVALVEGESTRATSTIELLRHALEHYPGIAATCATLLRRDYAATHLEDAGVLRRVTPERLQAFALAHGGRFENSLCVGGASEPTEEIYTFENAPRGILVCLDQERSDWAERAGDSIRALALATGLPAHVVLADVLPEDLGGDLEGGLAGELPR